MPIEDLDLPSMFHSSRGSPEPRYLVEDEKWDLEDIHSKYVLSESGGSACKDK